MKVKLYYVSKDNWVDNELGGLYTEKEFEDLRKEVIENYRDCDDYIYDVQKYIDEHLICEAALGFENSVEEFKREIERMEEETLDDFISDYVDIYEKEI
jgi:hypothetical protein